MKQDPLAWRPGRSCPLHYRYQPSVFAKDPDLAVDTLYVVGGLYGNMPALENVLDMFAQERGVTALVFNGDFNWFNADNSGFAAINNAVLSHRALRGNVETEIAADDGSAGCGCAYPASVSDADVARSNAMLERLRETALHYPGLRGRLRELPMHAVAQVGALRVGLVHGDAESLAGWQFDVSSLDDVSQRQHLSAMFAAAQVDGFASSHTCLPALRQFSLASGYRWIINNGAAGMPNFTNSHFGVLTRISVQAAAPSMALYGMRSQGAFVDAIQIRYDQQRWLEEFLANWPPGSPGHASYYERIARGPRYSLERADVVKRFIKAGSAVPQPLAMTRATSGRD